MLHQFIQENNSDKVQICISEGADVNQLVDGYASLHLAAYLGCAKIARILVEAGADVSLADEHSRLPIDYAKKSDKTGTLKKALQLNTAEAWNEAIDAEHKDRLSAFAENELLTLYPRTQYSRFFSNNIQYLMLRDRLEIGISTGQLKNISEIRNFITEHLTTNQTQLSTAPASFNSDG